MCDFCDRINYHKTILLYYNTYAKFYNGRLQIMVHVYQYFSLAGPQKVFVANSNSCKEPSTIGDTMLKLINQPADANLR